MIGSHNTYTLGNGNFTSFISIPYCANHNSPSPKAMPTHNTYTAGNGNFTSFISIPYCANHDLPSPTDFHLLTTKEPAVGAGSDSVISVTAVQSGGR